MRATPKGRDANASTRLRGACDYADWNDWRGFRSILWNFAVIKASQKLRFVDTLRGAIRIAVAPCPFTTSFLVIPVLEWPSVGLLANDSESFDRCLRYANSPDIPRSR